MNSAPRILIFANGLVPDPDRVRALLGPDDIILCADGGTRLALALDLTPTAVFGDLDSLAGADRAHIESVGIPIHQFPRDKDQTDLELTLLHALTQQPGAILIIGAMGGRLDHTLGNISLLADPRLTDIDCRLDDGVEEVLLCRGHSAIHGKPGDLVSLIPWGNAVAGVRTEGLRWKLAGDALDPDKSRGISNEMLGSTASVQVESGRLIIVHSRRS